MREYFRRPEVRKKHMARLKKYFSNPKNVEKRKKWQKEYNKTEKRKESIKKYQKKFRSSEKRKTYIKEYQKNWAKKPENRKKFNEYQKEYYKKPENKEKRKKYQTKYNRSEKRKAQMKKYLKKYMDRIKDTPEFKEKRRALQRNWQRKKMKEDKFHRMRMSLTARLWQTLKRKGTVKKAPIFNLIGCNKNFLKKYLENRFYDNPKTKEKMTWDNYGRKGWEIDHVKPISSFKLEDLSLIETQKKIMHYTNLQPMWGFENREKGDKY